MSGKEIILKYCSQFDDVDIVHMERAIENKELIKKGKYRELNGCPSVYGLSDFTGLCEIEDEVGIDAEIEQCERCWKKALDVQ